MKKRHVVVLHNSPHLVVEKVALDESKHLSNELLIMLNYNFS